MAVEIAVAMASIYDMLKIVDVSAISVETSCKESLDRPSVLT